MANGFYSGYDPISANGILYAPINDLVFSDAPVTTSMAGYPNPQFNAAQVDKFISTAKNPNPTPSWKKWAFWTLMAGLAIFGLKKFKINPFKKLFKNFPEKHPKITNAYTSTKEFITKKYHSAKEFVLKLFKKK